MAMALQTHSVGLFIRQKEPANLETPLDQVNSCLKFHWLTPKKSGRYTLLARARGADGSVQPDKHDQNYGSYVINPPLPIEVFVEGPTGASA